MQAKDIRYTIEDFYALPEGTRAELIDGVIYDMSPSPLRIHQRISFRLSGKIDRYIEENKGNCQAYSAPFDVTLSDNTIVQPDISVICDPNKLTDKGCSGAPDWVIEITSSNEAHDYVTKLNLYKHYNVREYWIINPKDESILVYVFDENIHIEKYDFSETIPVWIYKDKPNPLEINISELL